MFLHYKRLAKWIRTNSPDVIISVGQSEKYIVPFLKGAVRIREVHFNSTYRFFTYANKTKAKILNFLDFNILSIFYDKYYLLTKQDKDENFRFDDKFSWMHNPTSFTKSRFRVPMSNRKPIVLAVGRLNYQKNFEALIRIWAEVAKEVDTTWILKIVGDGPEFKKLQNLSDSFSLGNRVVFAGRSNNVMKEMETASIFTLTSKFEGFALVLTEALACGLPIVSFDTKYGPKDVVRDSIDGFLVSNSDEKQFKERLVQLITDFNLRERFSSEAYKYVDDFDINVIAEKWMNEYNQLLDKRK